MELEIIDGGVTAPKGFMAGGIHCGIRANKSKPDLAMICSDVICNAAAVYTQNLVKGAPIIVSQKNLENGKAQAVFANSGNANTCNADGLEKAQKMCDIAAAVLGISPDDVIVASTGVIGKVLPIEPIESGAMPLKTSLSYEGSTAAATAIMTTDLISKEAAVKLNIGGKELCIGGIAKGSGMIHPNMATMLSFVTTDCAISAPMLQKAIKQVADISFNMISIDGDTSTNDMFSVMANGMAGNEEIDQLGPEYDMFCAGLEAVCKKLSMAMAADGEGATKLLICSVSGAPDQAMAKQVAKSVICSSLTKAAMFGADANWGRVLCAIGYSGADVDVRKIDVSFKSSAGEIAVCREGAGIAFSEEVAARVLAEKEIDILVNLNLGKEFAQAYGCDLTYDYVKINGEYRS